MAGQIFKEAHWSGLGAFRPQAGSRGSTRLAASMLSTTRRHPSLLCPAPREKTAIKPRDNIISIFETDNVVFPVLGQKETHHRQGGLHASFGEVFSQQQHGICCHHRLLFVASASGSFCFSRAAGPCQCEPHARAPRENHGHVPLCSFAWELRCADLCHRGSRALRSAKSLGFAGWSCVRLLLRCLQV